LICRRLLWSTDSASIDIDIPYIILHAVTHDPSSYPKPCLYCQFNVDNECSDENDEEESRLESEMFLCPSDENQCNTVDTLYYIIFIDFLIYVIIISIVQSMFEALSHAALLNPDEDEGM
jgi:hypothetical protein